MEALSRCMQEDEGGDNCNPQRNVIDSLPHELELHLFTFFSVHDIASVVAVSKVRVPSFLSYQSINYYY